MADMLYMFYLLYDTFIDLEPGAPILRDRWFWLNKEGWWLIDYSGPICSIARNKITQHLLY